MVLENLVNSGKEPLIDYPWYTEVERLTTWLKDRNSETRCFAFDLVMSLAFIDATSGLERFIQYCPNCPEPFNLHLGFINLCSPCLEKEKKWTHQKAAKPQSGVLGKLSSEVILSFVFNLSDEIESIKSLGGQHPIDAVITHRDGFKILSEVKSAPLITYPVLFATENSTKLDAHRSSNLSTSQFLELDSALYLHQQMSIPLGKPKDPLWPFKACIDYITAPTNKANIERFTDTWKIARAAYAEKNREEIMFYLANASGKPPAIARERDNWPQNDSISDGKTSAGMDRTDDIKKGIYQTLKIGTLIRDCDNPGEYKTALISNLSAFRHGDEYINPFVDMVWGIDEDIEENAGISYIQSVKLKRVFDYILTLDDPILRDLKL
jgi:hypothetical protein